MKIYNRKMITGLTRDDLRILLGGKNRPSWLSMEFDADFYRTIPERDRSGGSDDDKIADVLSAMGRLSLIDNTPNAVCRECGMKMSDGTVKYDVDMDDIEVGLEIAANGDFVCDDDQYRYYCPYIKDALDIFAKDGRLDSQGCDFLLQIIMFNEIIYKS